MLSALTTRGSSLLRARRLIMGAPGATAPTPVVSEAEGRPMRAMRAPWRRVVWPYALAAYVALLVLLVAVLPEARGVALGLERAANYLALAGVVAAVAWDMRTRRRARRHAPEAPTT